MATVGDETTAAGQAEVLAAWEKWLQNGYLQAGHLRSMGVVSRPALAEIVYHAFCAAWMTGAATERARIVAAGAEYVAVIRQPTPEAQGVHDIVMATLRDLLEHLVDGTDG